MHPAVSLIVENVLRNLHIVIPILFVLLSTISNAFTPIEHSLLVTTISWALIWVPALFRAGVWSGGSRSRKVASWLAGAFLALGHICDRAARDRQGIWQAKGLLPILVVFIAERDPWSRHVTLPSLSSDSYEGASNTEKRPHTRSSRMLAVITASSLAALATRFTVPSTWTLALSSVIFFAAGLVLFESALKDTKEDTTNRRGFMSANGTVSRRNSLEGAQKVQHLASLRDVAIVMTVLCGLGTYIIEGGIDPDVISWKPAYNRWGAEWRAFHYHRTVQRCTLMIIVNVLVNGSMFIVLLQKGAAHVSLQLLFSFICAQQTFAISLSGIWFTIIFGLATTIFMYNTSTSTDVNSPSSIRFGRIISGVTALSLCFLFMRYATSAEYYTMKMTNPESTPFDPVSQDTPYAPLPVDLSRGHPARQLIAAAEKEFQGILGRQSKSLDQAVLEYRRRNGIPPPPHFDKWYEFATRNKIQLIDEFDMINDMLLPFWGVKPSTVRGRVKAALGHQGNALVGIMIRNNNVVKVEGGQDWQQQATIGMMKDFLPYLPDMDLAFNIHDEPRVVVPNDALSQLVAKARHESIPAAMKMTTPRNSFSPRPSDMSNGKRFEEVKTSRFNEFAHQQTWTHARLSCSLDSPARGYEQDVADNLTSYATAPLNYIYNHTAFSDICNSPSLSSTFGFFERPNAFNVIHELTPIFSQSKVSSFQDLLYPSPWYWFGKVEYDKHRDTTWENKTNSLYWRGSTTGGFSRNGGWRRQHRQRVVRRLNALDKAKMLVNKGSEDTPSYAVQETARKEWSKYIDVKFSHVGQCDPGDCDAQKEFFHVTEQVDREEAMLYKHLLDMDGNAFSGRFYSFLQSKSLTYKMAIFREWHQEWLKPWVHYVPLSLIGDEHLDLVRWFGGAEKLEKVPDGDNKGNGNSVGEQKAKEIAERSTEWANMVLRKPDFEAWFFRMLLEYGRLIDDDRDVIGFPGL
ncbi:hypothetical protein EJ04DRAFT_573562 [Polyplosphaeria fusca]|uniref:Glycosyl transferase CAP10 domain-containing protein n=1 Tax=Polyplosphaeria fusca TaxID=682080 RepID=A0A9P4R4Q5_9PLEO|nr:hypothetical protein EJ04DRAFT_573562 [Polyplosphaeria fusca]